MTPPRQAMMARRSTTQKLRAKAPTPRTGYRQRWMRRLAPLVLSLLATGSSSDTQAFAPAANPLPRGFVVPGSRRHDSFLGRVQASTRPVKNAIRRIFPLKGRLPTESVFHSPRKAIQATRDRAKHLAVWAKEAPQRAIGEFTEFATGFRPGTVESRVASSPLTLSFWLLKKAFSLPLDSLRAVTGQTEDSQTIAALLKDYGSKSLLSADLSAAERSEITRRLQHLQRDASTQSGLAGFRARRAFAKTLKSIAGRGGAALEGLFSGNLATITDEQLTAVRAEITRLSSTAGADPDELARLNTARLALEDARTRVGSTRDGAHSAFLAFLRTQGPLPAAHLQNPGQQVLYKFLKRSKRNLYGTQIPGNLVERLLANLSYDRLDFTWRNGYPALGARYLELADQTDHLLGEAPLSADQRREASIGTSIRELSKIATGALERAVDPDEATARAADPENRKTLPVDARTMLEMARLRLDHLTASIPASRLSENDTLLLNEAKDRLASAWQLENLRASPLYPRKPEVVERIHKEARIQLGRISRKSPKMAQTLVTYPARATWNTVLEFLTIRSSANAKTGSSDLQKLGQKVHAQSAAPAMSL